MKLNLAFIAFSSSFHFALPPFSPPLVSLHFALASSTLSLSLISSRHHALTLQSCLFSRVTRLFRMFILQQCCPGYSPYKHRHHITKACYFRHNFRMIFARDYYYTVVAAFFFLLSMCACVHVRAPI